MYEKLVIKNTPLVDLTVLNVKYTIPLKGRFKPMIKDHTFKPIYAPVYTHRLKAMKNLKNIF